MIQIPWADYSEIEILEVLSLLFRKRGYQVYNVHKIDRSGEDGADLECSKTGETEKILVAVKKKPRKNDVGQLKTFAKRSENMKIYVYIEEPSTFFREAMQQLDNRISFWNAEKLTNELFSTDTRFYLFMVLENSFQQPIFDLSYSFVKKYLDLTKKRAGKPIKADAKMLNLLWAAKDRSVSLNKVLRTLQKLFEGMSLSDVDDNAKRSIVEAFLNSLEDLKFTSLDALYDIFQEFLEKYPTNFEQFCEQTKGRSNWLYFSKNKPELSPNFILESLERSYDFEAKIKDVLAKHEILNDAEQDDLAYVLGDVSRILANEVMMFEDAVDDLFSISLWGKWDDIRGKFANMPAERTKELKNYVKDDLNAKRKEISHNLDEKKIVNSFYSAEIFDRYREELSHRLDGNTFETIKIVYQKVSLLNKISKFSTTSENTYKEVLTLIDETLNKIDSSDEWDMFREARRFSV